MKKAKLYLGMILFGLTLLLQSCTAEDLPEQKTMEIQTNTNANQPADHNLNGGKS
jgi:hypothetical protein